MNTFSAIIFLMTIILDDKLIVNGQLYDGVLMKDYTDDYYRILDCDDCFKAQGRMCHHKDYTVEVNVLQSSNYGLAICCKLDSTEGYCSNDPAVSDYVCSMPSIDEDTSSDYKDVLTSTELRNYQMFAYCPYLKQKFCGISDLDSTDMTLEATSTPQVIKTNSMFFKKSRTSALDFRKYDFCHYLIRLKTDEKLYDVDIQLADTTIKDEIDQIYKDSKSNFLTL